MATAASPSAPPLPLAGIRILDMTRVLAGPYCTQILGDLGAEVIKIEHPTRGDDTRAWGPPYADYVKGDKTESSKESAYFIAANRNKKSLALSFTTPEGQAILHSLARNCDVLVENFLPGTLAKYKLDYPTVSKINASLIYASITGYGQTGPYSTRAGYDVMVEAEFGLMHITGDKSGPPSKVGVAVTDLTTGLYTANSILASLLRRALHPPQSKKSSSPDSESEPKSLGPGTYIDASLSDCQTATLSNIASSVLISGKPDSGRWGTAHPSIVPYQAFPTLKTDQDTTSGSTITTSSEGREVGKGGSGPEILIGAGNDKLFTLLSTLLNQPTWPTSPLYSTNSARVANRIDLISRISRITSTKPLQHWLEVFAKSGIPHAPVNDVKTALEHPHTQARGMVREVEHERCGPLKVVGPAVRFAGVGQEEEVVDSKEQGREGEGEGNGKRSKMMAPPWLGQHTDSVLSELLGMSGDRIQDLREKGVVA